MGAAGITTTETLGPDYAERLDEDPALHQPVARGPLPLGNRVHENLLNCNRGLRSGHAIVERQFPLLTRSARTAWKPAPMF